MEECFTGTSPVGTPKIWGKMTLHTMELTTFYSPGGAGAGVWASGPVLEPSFRGERECRLCSKTRQRET